MPVHGCACDQYFWNYILMWNQWCVNVLNFNLCLGTFIWGSVYSSVKDVRYQTTVAVTIFIKLFITKCSGPSNLIFLEFDFIYICLIFWFLIIFCIYLRSLFTMFLMTSNRSLWVHNCLNPKIYRYVCLNSYTWVK